MQEFKKMQADVKQAHKNKQTKKIPVRNIKDLGIYKKRQNSSYRKYFNHSFASVAHVFQLK